MLNIEQLPEYYYAITEYLFVITGMLKDPQTTK